MSPEKSRNPVLVISGGVAIVIVIVIAVLLIRDENKKTRETLEKVSKETREEMSDAIKEGVEGVVQEDLDEMKEIPAEIFGEIIDIIKGEDEGDADADGEEGGNTAQDLLSKAFDLGRESFEIGNEFLEEMAGLDVDDENELGQKLHSQILELYTVVDSTGKQERIDKLAEPLLEMRDRKGINYTFTIVDDPAINAFALPGGYIYVHTGLLDFVANDVELQYVLGHEIGHVDLKHCAETFTLAVRVAQISFDEAAVPVAALYRLYALQFTEDDEFEADAYGYRRLRRLGYSKVKALGFERHIIAYYKSEGIETSQAEPQSIPELLEQEFTNHFRTHPPDDERLQRLEAIKVPGIDQSLE